MSTKTIAEWGAIAVGFIAVITAIITVASWSFKLDNRISELEKLDKLTQKIFSHQPFVDRLSYQILAKTGINFPPGTILAFAGDVSNKISEKYGWLLCDGSSVSRKEKKYEALFNIIGTKYGGDGVNSFKLPDLRGRTLVGVGMGTDLSERKLGQSFGEEEHTLTIDEIPSHIHKGITKEANSISYRVVHEAGNTTAGHQVTGWRNGASHNDHHNDKDYPLSIHTHNFDTGGGQVGSQSHNNMQPSFVINYIIKY